VDIKPTIPEEVGLGVLVNDLLTVGDLVVVDEVEAVLVKVAVVPDPVAPGELEGKPLDAPEAGREAEAVALMEFDRDTVLDKVVGSKASWLSYRIFHIQESSWICLLICPQTSSAAIPA
jgi:hypothetical protein